jgi:hypothetical protein
MIEFLILIFLSVIAFEPTERIMRRVKNYIERKEIHKRSLT